jgi:hypothetical protein
MWDSIAKEEDFSIQSSLQGVDVLSSPKTSCHHRGTDVDEEGASKAASELLDNVRFCSSQFPSQDI